MLSIAVLLALAALAVDLSRSPANQISVAVALAAIHSYQAHLAAAVGRVGIRCRFEPSCSEYAATVIERFGALRGGWLAVRRLVRCGPWTPAGSIDPPPPSDLKR